MGYQPIENYGIIGDLHTVALVGMDGSIDFMCLPEFDSPSLFARILDREKGGFFQIAPVLGDAHQRQIYLPDTAVLLSRFLSSSGVAEVSDFMPVGEGIHACTLVRRAKTVRGEVSFRMTCRPAFDYGRAEHRVEVRDGEVLFLSEANDGLAIRLRSDLPVEVRNGGVVAEFTLGTGQTATFILEEAKPRVASQSVQLGFGSEMFRNTVNYWRTWIGASK